MNRWMVTLDKDGSYHCMRLGGGTHGTSYEADLEWTAIEAKRENVKETWLVEAPTRHQAMKIARQDVEKREETVDVRSTRELQG